MRRGTKLWLPGLLLAITPTLLQAQQPATITGRVTDVNGQAIPSASVYIKQFDIGVITNGEGRYSLTVPASRINGQTVTLMASEIGYKTVAVPVHLQSGPMTQDFKLQVEPLRLSQIVATGQGTQTTRARLASAVSTVSGEDIQRSQEVNTIQALASAAPGVQVVSSSGDPGAGSYIRIRDAASITGGTQPLIVVDGTPIDNSSVDTDLQGAPAFDVSGTAITNGAAALNPADIANVQILKGAAATAIYGSRASNGVVLITTKSGHPGATRATLTTTFSTDHVTRTVPLQTQYGQGSAGKFQTGSSFSWGPLLGAGTPTYNHSDEVYRAGNHWETNLTLSGGSERTTYYLSVGKLGQQGVIVGPQGWNRTSVRLKGSDFLFDNLRVSGNIAYVTSGGSFVQQGSNISGIQLGALRTPPDFNNQPYIDPGTGIQRTYRDPNPTSLTSFHGYDNPFWVAYQEPNTTKAGRAMGNVSVEYTPLNWLKFNYLLGNDYNSDDRLQIFPKGSDAYLNGAIGRNTIIRDILDSNLSATASGDLNDNLTGSLTIGQNLDQTRLRINGVSGTTLLNGTQETNFAVTNTGSEFRSVTRTDGYFATGELTIANQLTLDATGRVDGSSTFGTSQKHFFYPGLGASWTFSSLPALKNFTALSFGKLRGSWGISGLQPPAYSNVSGFNTGFFIDGWVTNGLFSLYDGKEGVFREANLGNANIKPERKNEWEAGTDLAFFNQRVGLSVTYYNRHTTQAILQVPVPPSTGYASEYANAAAWKNNGWEAELDLQPVSQNNFTWSLSAQYSRDRSCVTDLAGAESLILNGFSDPAAEVVGPTATGKCQPFDVLFGSDFIRYGRGSTDQNTGDAIDGTSSPAAGTIYVGADGFPQLDPQPRVIGNPNPSWTGSLRNTFTLFRKVTISGLLGISRGNQMWNGTKGALSYFGTPAFTAKYHGNGVTETYAQYCGCKVAGPGADLPVTFNEDWFNSNIGSGFTGPSSQFVENAGFVKLRDLSLTYNWTAPFVHSMGFNSVDLTVAGRNLYTWTKYTGIDPESNLTGQTNGRGLDYFNNPQTRSFVFTLTLNR